MNYAIRVIKRSGLNKSNVMVTLHAANKTQLQILFDERKNCPDFARIRDVYAKDAVDVQLVSSTISFLINAEIGDTFPAELQRNKMYVTAELHQEFHKLLKSKFITLCSSDDYNNVSIISAPIDGNPVKIEDFLNLSIFSKIRFNMICDRRTWSQAVKYHEILEKLRSEAELTVDDYIDAVDVLNCNSISGQYEYCLEKILE